MNMTIANILVKNSRNFNNDLIHENNRSLTHEELEKKSNQLANFLIAKGVSKGDRIGIYMKNSINSIIVVFGILKVGAVYVPLDKKKTERQIQQVIEQTSLSILFSDERLEKSYLFNNSILIENNSTHLEDLIINYETNFLNRKIEVDPLDAAYIIFTSGTTGDPKGIVMPHRSVVNFTYDVVKRFNHTSSDRTICRTPMSFDPFLTEILPSVISGGKVFLQDREASITSLLKLIESCKITNFGCGPSLFNLLLKVESIVRKYDLSSLKEIYFGYEMMGIGLLRKMQELLPNVKFINGYGTSESFAATTYYECTKKTKQVYIGSPIVSSKIYLWNFLERRVCNNGEVGEIVISGSTLMLGYWNNHEATKKVLREDPFEKNKLALFTNDMGKYIDGNIVFIGRMDKNIKLHGYRINLDEVSEAIYNFNDIKEIVVIKDNEELKCRFNRLSGSKEYYDIISFLKESIEDYKIPTVWEYCDIFERNSNGKLITV